MKISHGSLETVRKNPRGFAKQPPHSIFGGPSAYRLWQLATRKVHTSSLEDAKKHLEKIFWKNLTKNPRNTRKLIELMTSLKEYSSQFNHLNHQAIKLGDKFSIEILQGLFFGGEIPRVDLKPKSGYSIVLFNKEAQNWQDELRMPLIQEAYAKKLGAPLKEIEVGVYCLKTNKHEFRTYSAREVKKSMEEMHDLAKIIKTEQRSK